MRSERSGFQPVKKRAVWQAGNTVTTCSAVESVTVRLPTGRNGNCQRHVAEVLLLYFCVELQVATACNRNYPSQYDVLLYLTSLTLNVRLLRTERK